jgi:hypothetical protein
MSDGKKTGSNKQRVGQRQQKGRELKAKRSLFLESLEDRRLLAGVPELTGITTDAGDHLYPDNQVVEYSPDQILLHFNEVAELDPTTLSGISVVGAGPDGVYQNSGVTTDFGLGAAVQVQFLARAPGEAGNYKITVSSSDHGNASGPYISVSEADDKEILIDLNTSSFGPTTVGDVVSGINDHGVIGELIEAGIVSGDESVELTSVDPSSYSPIFFNATDDIAVESGFVGLQGGSRQVVFRFADHVEEGVYRISIPGQGPLALKDMDGTPFGQAESDDEEGLDFSVEFEVELAPVVKAVVPQPIVHGGDGAEQLRDSVFVYFNDDDLDSESVQNPEFYRLIYTNDTVETSDDISVVPTSVNYSPEVDLVHLQFAGDLDSLVPGGGLFRLRVGDGTVVKSSPAIVPQLTVDAGDSFGTALDFGSGINVGSDASGFRDSEQFAVRTSGGQLGVFEFVFPGGTAQAGSVPVNLAGTETAQQVAEAISSSIHGAGLPSVQVDVVGPTDAGDAVRISLAGGESVYTADLGVDAAAPETVLDVDGVVFSVDRNGDGQFQVDYELDLGVVFHLPSVAQVNTGDELLLSGIEFGGDDLSLEFIFPGDTAQTGNVPVNLDGSESVDQLFGLIEQAFVAADVSVQVNSLGGDRVQFLADGSLDVDATNAPGFQDKKGGVGSQSGQLIQIIPIEGYSYSDLMSDVASYMGQAGYGGVEAFGESVFLGGAEVALVEVAGSSLVSSSGLDISNYHSWRFTASIGGDPGALQYPGHLEEVGHRDIPIQHHVHGPIDLDPNVPVYNYSFPINYGVDPNGNTLLNAITEEQKTRARQGFDLYSRYLGVRFVETDASGIKIAVGDVAALDPDLSNSATDIRSVARPEGVGVGTIVMNFQAYENVNTERFGDLWFRDVMTRSGQIIGLGQTNELPEFQLSGDEPALTLLNESEPVFPGDHDIVHGRLLYRPDGNDIDVYSVEVDDVGTLHVELLAERLANPSQLDAVVSVYKDGELLGRNDAYFSNDPYLLLENLEPGQYSIAVSSVGNTAFDLNVPDTGAGGLSTGRYELNVKFTPDAVDVLKDVDGSALDGDLDGLAGGNYNAWLNLVSESPRVVVAGDHLDLVDGDFIALTGSDGQRHELVVVRTQDVETVSVNEINVFDSQSQADFVLSLGQKLAAIEPGAAIDQTADLNVFDITGVRKLEVSTSGDVLRYAGRTLFVDGSDVDGLGTLDSPIGSLALATSLSQSGDVIRVLGDAGQDGDWSTLADNASYELGFSKLNGQMLADGPSWEIPKGVTAVIDSGVIFKSRRGAITVGSSHEQIDRSNAALQVLGVPAMVSVQDDGNGGYIYQPMIGQSGQEIPGHVYFTSIFDSEKGVDQDPFSFPQEPSGGDWGGIAFTRQLDSERSERWDNEDRGIFLNIVNYASIEFGGGATLIDGRFEDRSALFVDDSRPTLTNNTIAGNANAAIAVTPDAFEESTYFDALSQTVPHTPDYDRVGPEIHGNIVLENSLNGLLVKVDTPVTGELEKVTASTRWDDSDIVHVLSENLLIDGNPGGLIREDVVPPIALVVADAVDGGEIPLGTYVYRLTYVDVNGVETLSSDATIHPTELSLGTQSVRLTQLPVVPEGFVARRVYRSASLAGGQQVDQDLEFSLVGEVNAISEVFLDDGSFLGGLLDDSVEFATRARLHGSVVVDPGVIVKIDGSRIDALPGSHFVAEGTTESPVVFTSLTDQRFGAGGTFDTRNAGGETVGSPGNWGGVYVGHTSMASLDHAHIAFGGGTTREQGTFATFNAIEVHQGDLRLANSVLEQNASGLIDPVDSDGSQANRLRGNYGENAGAVVFVRGAQPVIINNVFQDNQSPKDEWTGSPLEPFAPININLNSMRHEHVLDSGRRTVANYPGGPSARQFDVEILSTDNLDNHGPLISGNILDNNDYNGLEIRGGTATTEIVWDDIDVTHLLFTEIVVPDFHTFGGMRIESSPYGSLVVKANGDDATIRATGRPLDIDDRVGGSLQLVGNPRYSVIMTGLCDYSVGAGVNLRGDLQVSADNDECRAGASANSTFPVGPEVDNGLLIDNDVATGSIGHFEYRPDAGGTANGSGVTAQGRTLLASNADFIFDYNNYIDLGANGGGVLLGATNVTMAPTLIGDDLVASEGNFAGTNGQIDWRVETHLEDGEATVYNTIQFSSESEFGTVRFISYLDEDVFGISDDLLWVQGDAASNSLKLFTLDDAERFGFAQSGETQPSAGLSGATFVGWAADEFMDLRNAITGAGENYTPAGNVDLGDLTPFVDPDLGAVFGLADVTTAMAWDLDATGTAAVIESRLELIPVNPTDVIVVGEWGGSTGGIVIEEFSHDGNVHVVTEYERNQAHIVGELNDGRYINSLTDEVQYGISNAQHLGTLATDLKSGDENARLGFKVHGFIAASQVDHPYGGVSGFAPVSDVDTYSFKAKTGTEIWFDIDHTSNSLDTVIELVDPFGQVIARSDDSTGDQGLDQDSAKIQSKHVNDLSKSSHGIYDDWTVNRKDAGLRIVMPGVPGLWGDYFVRVYSQSADGGPVGTSETGAGNGQSWGVYQLNMRLREQELFPGSMIQYADIRRATTGVVVDGQLIHSPLLGESEEVEIANDTIDAAQDLGNLFNTDMATLSIAGDVSGAADVDWYKFDLIYDSTHGEDELLFGQQYETRYASVVLDLDYADGLGGADTSISLFRRVGGTDAAPIVELINIGENSNISDDQAKPLSGVDTQDLARGSVGGEDPWIGPVALPAGFINEQGSESEVYYVAVYPSTLIGSEQAQSVLTNPVNPDLRIEVPEHFEAVVEERFNSESNRSATEVLIDDQAFVPFHLGDTSLVVMQSWGPRSVDTPVTVRTNGGEPDYLLGLDEDESNLWIVDPLTGMSERRDFYDADGNLRNANEIPVPCGTLTPSPVEDRVESLGSFRDVAVRNDGGVFGYTVTDSNHVGVNVSDVQAGDLHQFDLGTCLSNVVQQDGTLVTTFVGEDEIRTVQPNVDGAPVTSNNGAGDGIQFEAMAFGWEQTRPDWGVGEANGTDQELGLRGFAVGNRPAFDWQPTVVPGTGDEANGDNPEYEYRRNFQIDTDLFEGGNGAFFNILYGFDDTTGEVISDPTDRSTADLLETGGAWTNKRELGVLITDFVANVEDLSAEFLFATEATSVDLVDYVAQWQIHDEDLLPVDLNDDTFADIAFQLNSGPDVRVTQDPEQGRFAMDGDRIFVDGVAFEIDTGSTIVINAEDATQIESGYFDIREDSRFGNTWELRFHLYNAANGRTTPLLDNDPDDQPTDDRIGDVFIPIPNDELIKTEQIAQIVADAIQNAWEDEDTDNVNDADEHDFRVRATTHPGAGFGDRITLEYDWGTIRKRNLDLSTNYGETGRDVDPTNPANDGFLTISAYDCDNITLCIHGELGLNVNDTFQATNEVVRVNAVGAWDIRDNMVNPGQVTEMFQGEPGDAWWHVEETTSAQALVEAIALAVNGTAVVQNGFPTGPQALTTTGNVDANTGGRRATYQLNVPASQVAGDIDKRASFDGDRLNFVGFEFFSDYSDANGLNLPADIPADVYDGTWDVSVIQAFQNGHEEMYSKGVFSRDYDGDGLEEGDEILGLEKWRNGQVISTSAYLDAKEQELRGTRPNSSNKYLGIGTVDGLGLDRADIYPVNFGAGDNEALIASAVARFINRAAMGADDPNTPSDDEGANLDRLANLDVIDAEVASTKVVILNDLLSDQHFTLDDPPVALDNVDVDGNPITPDGGHAKFMVPDLRFRLAETGAGGLVTGMDFIYEPISEAEIQNDDNTLGFDYNQDGVIDDGFGGEYRHRIFMVSDSETNTSQQDGVVSVGGGIFEVLNGDLGNPILTQVNQGFGSQYLGTNFQGLAAGPAHVEDGRYAETLFAIDAEGNLHAFDMEGQPEAIFANGTASIATGITNATGLDFSNLDFNLWHETDTRAADTGHGINETPTRDAEEGGTSIYFGMENLEVNGVLDLEDPADRFANNEGFYSLNYRDEAARGPGNGNYNFPIDAHGSVQTHPFSLRNYSAADEVKLFFAYFADTADISAELKEEMLDGLMKDSFRVYANANNGDWTLLTTNNGERGPLPDPPSSTDIDDEFDLDRRGEIRETFDVADWRQAVVDLSEFAGKDNVRLRFDFTTKGASETGDVRYDANGNAMLPVGGQELLFTNANEIADGSFVEIDGGQDSESTFEIDLGLSLRLPGGKAISDGEILEVVYRLGHDDPITPGVDESDPYLITQEFVFVEDSQVTVSDLTLQIDLSDRVQIPFNAGMSASELTNVVDDIVRLALNDLSYPVSMQALMTGVQVFEPNSNALEAYQTPLVGGDFSFDGFGQIGDIARTTPVDELDDRNRDVDFLSLEAFDGDVLRLTVDTAGAWSDPAVSVAGDEDGYEGLKPAIRIFDEYFQEVTPSVNEAVLTLDANAVEATYQVDLEFHASRTGKYYVGISSIGNDTYEAENGTGVASPLLPEKIDPNTEEALPIEPRPVGTYQFAIESKALHWPLIRYENNHLQMLNAELINVDSDSKIEVLGSKGLNDSTTNNYVVPVRVNMSAAEVGDVFREVYASRYVEGQTDVVKSDRGRVFIHMHEITDVSEGFGLITSLEGDAAGNADASRGVSTRPQDGHVGFEGIYLDDIMVGATERGVLVTGSGNDTTFVAHPFDADGAITTGSYQLEIRRASEYGVGIDPIGSEDSRYVISEVVSTNSRYSQQRSVVTPSGAHLIDGMLLTISDGVDSVVYEFADQTIDDGVAEGHLAVAFSPTDSEVVVARSLIAAINSTDSQQVPLDIQAAASDYSRQTNPSATNSNIVNLFGNALFEVYTPFFTTTVLANADALANQIASDDLVVENARLVSGTSSAGYFEGTEDVLGFDSGVVISTGDISSIGNQNSQIALSGTASAVADGLVEQVAGVTTFDSTSLSFDFVATGTELFVSGVYASEQYPETVTNFSTDRFVAVLKDHSTANPWDMEVLDPRLDGAQPNTLSINPGVVFGIDGLNSELYRDNSIANMGQQLNDFYTPNEQQKEQFAFDGFSDVLHLSTSGLVVGNTYTLTLAIADTVDSEGDSAFFIQTDSIRMTSGPLLDGNDASVVGGIHYDGFGDWNTERLQGQLVIDSSSITNSLGTGIEITAGARGSNTAPGAGDLPTLGSPKDFGIDNVDRLAPGVVISNNIIAHNGASQITVSGEDLSAAGDDSATPFGRIINNTIIGDPVAGNTTGISGIVIGPNASPTILNNVIAFTGTGIEVDPSSESTVLGGNVYADNQQDVSTNVTLGDFAITAAGQELFVGAEAGIYYPSADSPLIDSSIDSLQDRINLLTLKQWTGVGLSPILAPERDALGQLRIDDPAVASPTGLGFNVTKDRGAIERADSTGPSAYLVGPFDNDVEGKDLDPRVDIVDANSNNLSEFKIRLVDNLRPISPTFGTGMDDTTVNSGAITVMQYNGVTAGELAQTLDCCNPNSGDEDERYREQLEENATRLEVGRDYSFHYNPVNNEITLKSLAGTFESNASYKIIMASADGYTIAMVAGEEISDGTYFDITDEDNDTVRFEFDSGFLHQIPRAAMLIMPDAEDLDTLNRTTFRIRGNNDDYSFEFDTDGSVFGDNVAIAYGLNDSSVQIATKTVAKLKETMENVHPKVIELPDGETAIHLGVQRDYEVSVNASSPLQLDGIEGVLDHHDYIIVDDGGTSVQFYFDFTTSDDETEFDPNENVSAVQEIVVSHEMTNDEFASALSTAVANASLGLSPNVAEDGIIQLGGDMNYQVQTSEDVNLQQLGAPGLLNSPWGIRVLGLSGKVIAEDGDSFTVTNSLTATTAEFEFDNDGSVTDANAIALNFSASTTVDQMVAEIVLEVNRSSLGLTAYNAGDGVVGFLDSSNVSLNVNSAMSSVTQVGSPGADPAVAIKYDITASAAAIAYDVEVAINSFELSQNGDPVFERVSANSNLEQVVIMGAELVVSSDEEEVLLIGSAGVEDIAGNGLLPNQNAGNVVFIVHSDVQYDYGDLGYPYQTSKVEGGPSHVVIEGFSLGTIVDVEADANRTTNANPSGDNDDGLANAGLSMETGYPVNLDVLVTNTAWVSNAYVKAWADYDSDGVFSSDEAIALRRESLANPDGSRMSTPDGNGEPIPVPPSVNYANDAIPVLPGDNQLWFDLPADALPGNLNVRMRLTSDVALSPSGHAENGEVEDYQFFVTGNPWHNAGVPEDVNRDGYVSPLDALYVIHYLNDSAANGTLPVPPTAEKSPQIKGYVDVTDDGFASPLDALNVINHLNSSAASGEAEGEFSGDIIVNIPVMSKMVDSSTALNADYHGQALVEFDDLLYHTNHSEVEAVVDDIVDDVIEAWGDGELDLGEFDVLDGENGG